MGQVPNKKAKSAVKIPMAAGAGRSFDLFAYDTAGPYGAYGGNLYIVPLNSSEPVEVYSDGFFRPDGFPLLNAAVSGEMSYIQQRIPGYMVGADQDWYMTRVYCEQDGWYQKQIELFMNGDYAETDYSDCVGKAVAVNPNDGKVYYLRDIDGATELFIVKPDANSNTLEKTHVADLSGEWNVIAFDDKGQLYGIKVSRSDSGDVENSTLYRVDCSNGSVTSVGATGQKPISSDGATIDANDGTLYWLVNEVPGEATRLVSVNTSTGASTTVRTFDAASNFTSLYSITGPDVSQPNAPADLEITFEGPSLTGKVKFKAPETNIGGTSDDPLTYTISYGENSKTGSCSYGEMVNAEVTVPAEGYYDFSVKVAAGTSESRSISRTAYAGRAIPPSAGKVNLTLDEAKQMFVLTWDEPNASYVDGYLDPEGFTYTVTRFPEGKVVASGIKELRFEESVADFPENFTRYYYKVDVYNFDKCSTGDGTSNRYALGYLIPPFSEDFEDGYYSLTGYTIADLDTYTTTTWKIAGNYLSANSSPSQSTPSDDWFITPKAYLEIGKTYFVELDAWSVTSSYGNKDKCEVLGIYAGTEPSAMALRDANELGTFRILGSTKEHIKTSFSPKASGYYYIGLRHNTSGINHLFGLSIDNLKFSTGVSDSAPVAPSIKVERQANGRLEADITLGIPAADMQGNAIDNVISIIVFRDGEPVKEFDKSELDGKTEVSFTDIVAEAGTHVWTAVAYNEAGAGQSTDAQEVFIGQLEAAGASGFKVVETDEYGKLHAEWNAVDHDRYGNEIDPSRVTYQLADMSSMSYLPTGGMVVNKYAGTSYDFDAFIGSKSNFQQWRLYALAAITDAGLGDRTYSDYIVTGKPVDEYFENFSEGYSNYHPVTTLLSESNCESFLSWEIYGLAAPGIMPYSGKGELVLEGMQTDDSARFTTIRFDLSNQECPAFSMMVYNVSDGNMVNENILDVEVKAEGSDTWEKVASRKVGELTSRLNTWAPYVVSLEAYKGKIVQVRVTGTIKNYSVVVVDDIRFGSVSPVDVAMTHLSVPATATPGKEFTAVAEVTNLGYNNAEDCNIVFEYNGVAREVSCPAIAAGGVAYAEATFTMPDYEDIATMDVKATAELSGDANVTDNTATATIHYINSLLPAPRNLQGEFDAETNAPRLIWEAPEKEGFEPVKEKFVGGEAFDLEAASYNDWIFIDRDQAPVDEIYGRIFPGLIPFETGVTKSSFFVFDGSSLASKYGYWITGYDDYTFLTSLNSLSENGADDWAISPELCGEAQVASMMVRRRFNSDGVKFSVYYSTGSTDPDDFIPVEGLVDVTPLAAFWTTVYIGLPEGARRLAIRSRFEPESNTMLHIDNVSFVSAKTTTMAPRRYRVYRDGDTKFVTVNNDALSWLDTETDLTQPHTYRVTAYYALGESAPTAPVTLTPAGLDKIGPDGADNLRVSTSDGTIRLAGCDGRHVAIFDTLGRCLFSSLVADAAAVRVAPGVYIVTVGDRSLKVMVRQ